MPIQTSDNNWSVARYIVDPVAGLGTHTTIQAAVTAAGLAGGDTVYVRPGTYIENITMSDNVVITGSLATWSTGCVIIKGKISSSVSCSISNIRLLTNADNILDISSGEIRISNCHFRIESQIGIVMSAGNIKLINCTITNVYSGSNFCTITGGALYIYNLMWLNTGANTTQQVSTVADAVVEIYNSKLYRAFTTSGTSSFSAYNSEFYQLDADNTILTAGGSGDHIIDGCYLDSLTKTCLTVNNNLTITNSTITTSNATAISGSGTINYSGLNFTDSSVVTTTTQNVLNEGPSKLIGNANSGGANTLTVTNTSNTASSSAVIISSVGGTSAADPVYQSTISGTQTWTWGADNSDSDAYVLAASSALGTTNVMNADTTGVITYPLQSAFLAVLQSAVSNATGNSTFYSLGTTKALTAKYDQNNDFYVGDGAGAYAYYTAPKTGKVMLGVWILFDSTTGATNCQLDIRTSNLFYRCSPHFSDQDYQHVNLNVVAYMDAGDTAYISTQLTGIGADTAGIVSNSGGNARGTYFYGGMEY